MLRVEHVIEWISDVGKIGNEIRELLKTVLGLFVTAVKIVLASLVSGH